VILKPGYAPVEQYAGDASLDQGAYTDIYALSAVIYFAIMKEAPATSIARMVKDPIVPLAERGVPGYSTEFLAAIDKGLAVMAHERPQTIDAFRELLGIASSGTPRARPNGDTQRFSTMKRLPEPGTPVTGERPAVNLGAGGALPANSGTPSRKKSSAPAGPTSALHATVPRWASRTALGVAILVIAGFGARWLLGTPNEVVMPAAPVEAAVVLPDASAAPAAAPAPVAEAPAVDPAAVAAAPEVVPSMTATDAAVAPGEKPLDTANYRLAIKPWATVYVDGVEKGVSPPLKKLVLTAGKHKIRIVNPNFPDYLMDVNLSSGKSGAIEYDFAAHSK
jgi:hypothetical protein